jgi:hypothetical protein
MSWLAQCQPGAGVLATLTGRDQNRVCVSPWSGGRAKGGKSRSTASGPPRRMGCYSDGCPNSSSLCFVRSSLPFDRAAILRSRTWSSAISFRSRCAPTRIPATGPATQPAPIDAPAPVDTKDRARRGEPVYRVYQYPGGNPLSEPWTPEDLKLYGPSKYRVVAGLPDALTLGNCLISGTLRDVRGILVQAAKPINKPFSYHFYPGGLTEYLIPAAFVQVENVRIETLDPPCGSDPDNPPRFVPQCPTTPTVVSAPS